MAVISPALLAATTSEFKSQMTAIERSATRVHIDITDGVFAPSKTISIDNVWWPDDVKAELHLMVLRPLGLLDAIERLRPYMVTVHAESQGSFVEFARALKAIHVHVGVALLQQTPVAVIGPALDMIDSVLIFSGDLGHYGGQAQLGLLSKVAEIRSLKPAVEIAWDGGINDLNAAELARGGVDVLNVGSFIHRAPDPRAALLQLTRLAQAAR